MNDFVCILYTLSAFFKISCRFYLFTFSKTFWVRNLERQVRFSFWLPTSTDKFYPDFVAHLNDGRAFVVEYKGGHLENADTDEKELVGRVWAQKSGNLFLMAWKENDGNLSQQIERALG